MPRPYVHPNFNGLFPGYKMPVMCSHCGNEDPDTMVIATEPLKDNRVEWIGYTCACCNHITRWTKKLHINSLAP